MLVFPCAISALMEDDELQNVMSVMDESKQRKAYNDPVFIEVERREAIFDFGILVFNLLWIEQHNLQLAPPPAVEILDDRIELDSWKHTLAYFSSDLGYLGRGDLVTYPNVAAPVLSVPFRFDFTLVNPNVLSHLCELGYQNVLLRHAVMYARCQFDSLWYYPESVGFLWRLPECKGMYRMVNEGSFVRYSVSGVGFDWNAVKRLYLFVRECWGVSVLFSGIRMNGFELNKTIDVRFIEEEDEGHILVGRVIRNFRNFSNFDARRNLKKPWLHLMVDHLLSMQYGSLRVADLFDSKTDLFWRDYVRRLVLLIDGLGVINLQEPKVFDQPRVDFDLIEEDGVQFRPESVVLDALKLSWDLVPRSRVIVQDLASLNLIQFNSLGLVSPVAYGGMKCEFVEHQPKLLEIHLKVESLFDMVDAKGPDGYSIRELAELLRECKSDVEIRSKLKELGIGFMGQSIEFCLPPRCFGSKDIQLALEKILRLLPASRGWRRSVHCSREFVWDKLDQLAKTKDYKPFMDWFLGYVNWDVDDVRRNMGRLDPARLFWTYWNMNYPSRADLGWCPSRDQIADILWVAINTVNREKTDYQWFYNSIRFALVDRFVSMRSLICWNMGYFHMTGSEFIEFCDLNDQFIFRFRADPITGYDQKGLGLLNSQIQLARWGPMSSSDKEDCDNEGNLAEAYQRLNNDPENMIDGPKHVQAWIGQEFQEHPPYKLGDVKDSLSGKTFSEVLGPIFEARWGEMGLQRLERRVTNYACYPGARFGLINRDRTGKRTYPVADMLGDVMLDLVGEAMHGIMRQYTFKGTGFDQDSMASLWLDSTTGSVTVSKEMKAVFPFIKKTRVLRARIHSLDKK